MPEDKSKDKQETILILDFGSQYTQLIARRVRELNVYCEIHPYTMANSRKLMDNSYKGIILSGSPFSVYDVNAPEVNLDELKNLSPVLGVCYGAQLMAHKWGGKVARSNMREYGRANLNIIKGDDELLKGISPKSQVWMSHADTISELPKGAELIARTESVELAAFRIKGEKVYGIQFHPEVFHTTEGAKVLKNFVVNICGCSQALDPRVIYRIHHFGTT